MKTTLDLPDDLLIEAKQVAARRRTTLKDLVTRSLRREIGFGETVALPPDSRYEISELGLPRLKKRGAVIDNRTVSSMLEEADREDFRSALDRLNP
jgi:hypothetical protein